MCANAVTDCLSGCIHLLQHSCFETSPWFHNAHVRTGVFAHPNFTVEKESVGKSAVSNRTKRLLCNVYPIGDYFCVPDTRHLPPDIAFSSSYNVLTSSSRVESFSLQERRPAFSNHRA